MAGSLARSRCGLLRRPEVQQFEPVETVTGQSQQIRQLPDPRELNTPGQFHRCVAGPGLQVQLDRLREPGQVLPREMLHQKVWGAGRDATYNNIEVYLTLVRRKLRAVGSKAELISERGIGYYLQEAE